MSYLVIILYFIIICIIWQKRWKSTHKSTTIIAQQHKTNKLLAHALCQNDNQYKTPNEFLKSFCSFRLICLWGLLLLQSCQSAQCFLPHCTAVEPSVVSQTYLTSPRGESQRKRENIAHDMLTWAQTGLPWVSLLQKNQNQPETPNIPPTLFFHSFRSSPVHLLSFSASE